MHNKKVSGYLNPAIFIAVILAAAFVLVFTAPRAVSAAGGDRGLKLEYSGYLSDRPRSDANIILKKVRDSLELRGISAAAYDLAYTAKTNSFKLRTVDESTRDAVIDTIAAIEKYYYETVRTEVIYLQYANSRETAALLNGIYTPKIFLKPAAAKNSGDKKAAGEQSSGVKIIKNRADNIDISSDTRTNSLVVTAPQNVVDLVKNTVQMIDRRTSLVHVKVLIAEITLDDTSQFGLEWKYAAQNRIGGASVRQDPSVDFANLNDPAKQAKLQGLKYSVIDGEKFSSFLQMLNSKSRINVLSSPQLLTTNNSKAYFEETIKVPTLQTTTTSTGVTSSSIEYQEIGIKLNVTPQVNRDEFINLNINQTIQNIIEASTIQDAPTFSHRLINTNVITKNGSTVVISGFIKDNVKKSIFRSPLLERVPYLKNLFSRSSTTKEKTELMIFITPRIAKTENSMENIVDKMPKSELKDKLEPIAKNYNDYEQETSEGRFVVVDVKDGTVILNGGKKDEIKQNDILFVYGSKRGASGRTGTGRNEDAPIARISVDIVKDKTSYASIIKKFENTDIASGDTARWPSGESEYFEDVRQTGYKNEEFIGLKERKFARTFTVKNITSAPINKVEASYVSMSPNLKYFMLAGSDGFVPLKMLRKREKGNVSYISVYLPHEIKPGEEAVIKTEDTLSREDDGVIKTIEYQASNPEAYSEMGRTVTRAIKTNMVMIVHHPYKIKIRDFDPEPVIMENKMGGHSLIWTHLGRTFDAAGKWRYEDAAGILKNKEVK
jgi:hypothetical protein